MALAALVNPRYRRAHGAGLLVIGSGFGSRRVIIRVMFQAVVYLSFSHETRGILGRFGRGRHSAGVGGTVVGLPLQETYPPPALRAY